MNSRGNERGCASSRGRASFTLVELLVVLAIMGMAMGMIAFLPKGAKRDADVEAAAQELASTLRYARSLAMDRHAIFAVGFNIQNAPGTSGKILNNWSGGHWYRVIGPADYWSGEGIDSFSVYPVPHCYNYPFSQFLKDVKNCWIGERHVLPQHHARFLALTDQDNGDAIFDSNPDPNYSTYPDTYPRPWFGRYDTATKRLYPWGGYDPVIVDKLGKNCSGFFFQGNEGAINGCTNPADRSTTDGKVKLLTKGEPRALVNGEWEDYQMAFFPDGTVVEDNIMIGRLGTSYTSSELQDMSCANYGASPGSSSSWYPEMTVTPQSTASAPAVMGSYVAHTGFWSITIAPDMTEDKDTYNSAQEAQFSFMPAYRVMINRHGDVKVVKVRPYGPPNLKLDTTLQATDWQTPAKTRVYYKHGYATDVDGFKRGMPVTDFVTPAILAGGNWWMVSP